MYTTEGADNFSLNFKSTYDVSFEIVPVEDLSSKGKIEYMIMEDRSKNY
ncbi:MAG: hypothetical protein QXV52_06135 [Nitrososphaeria archaeon]